MSYAITISIEGRYVEGGTVSINGEPVTGTVYVDAHDSIEVDIDPRSGYRIETVVIDSKSYGEVESIHISDITEDHAIAVVFALKVNTDITNLDVCGEDGIYIDPPDTPSGDCCDELENEVQAIREWVTDVQDSIPTKTSELVNDEHFVADAFYVHTDNNFTASDKTKLDGIEAGAEVNVQADWNEADSTADSYIKNKPTIPPTITVDATISSTSQNPVENRAIYDALDAKQDAGNYVETTGDTMTGLLAMETSNITEGNPPSSGSQYGDEFFVIEDSGGVPVGQAQAVYTSGDEIGVYFGANRMVGGSQVDNKIRLLVGASGDRKVFLSSPAAWRSALGLVPTAVSGLSAGTNVSIGSNTFAWTMGDLCMVTLNIQFSANIASGSVVVKDLPQNSSKQVSFAAARGGSTYSCALRIQGGATTITADGAISQTGWYDAFFMYVMA